MIKIIRDHIEDLMNQTGYSFEQVYQKYLNHGIKLLQYPDPEVEAHRNAWLFFDEKEKEIQAAMEVSLECVLFSKYYHAVQYTKEYLKREGFDAGIEQKCDFVFEEICNRIPFDEMHWDVLQAIDEGRYDEEYGAFQ